MTCIYVCKLIAFLLVSPFVFCNNVIQPLQRRTLNAASATHSGARYFPLMVIANKGRSSVLLTCSLWCYGHHTLMLCALPSQECCDVEIKALDLSGWKPQRPLRSYRVRTHTHAHIPTLTYTEKPHGQALLCCVISVLQRRKPQVLSEVDATW